MAIGSGLSAQLGFAQESVVGTAVTVTRFLEFNSESLSWEPTFIEGTGLRAGTKHKRAARVVQSRVGASGSVEMDFATRGMGLLVKHMLGSATSTATQQGATTAYKQIHTPGDFTGLGLTTQVGRPQTDGTVKPFTYNGCKVTGWEFSCSDGELATLSLDMDAWNESTATALATASYTAGSEVFHFAQASVFKIGGTAATASGEVSITGGTAVTSVVRGITISGETPLANERYGLGSSGVKKEQIENDTPTITGSLDTEFTNQAEIYDLFKANTTTALQLTFVGSQIATTGYYNTLDIVIPALKFKTAPVNVDGPDIVAMSVDFEAYSDGTNAPIQFALTSADTAP